MQNPAMKRFLEDVQSDTNVSQRNLETISKKVKKLDESGVPFRVKHLRKLQPCLGNENVTLPAKITALTRGKSGTSVSADSLNDQEMEMK